MAGVRQVMIVGNGPVADNAATLIDAADFVIRFNGSRNYGVAGRRTDVVALCNTGRPAAAMLADPAWRDSDAVREASEIWSVRHPEKFAELRVALAASHPELDDFCDDYTEEFAAFATAKGKGYRVISPAVHEAVDAALADHRAEAYVVPSSGMVVVAAVLSDMAHANDNVVLAGFSHVGWDGHPFEAEKRLIESYIAAGRLTRLQPVSASSLSQGA